MKKQRRGLAIALVILGGVLLFLAPDSIFGVVLLVLGVVIEVVGIFLEHRRV